ncbi:MAG: hypothetical protein E7613_02045 [Ruminococcaceae bacterium]|nr:hypothetical protein [Oscillospiraceae bacterium]
MHFNQKVKKYESTCITIEKSAVLCYNMSYKNLEVAFLKKACEYINNLKPTKHFYITLVIVYLFAIICECGMLPFSRPFYSVLCLVFILFGFLSKEPLVKVSAKPTRFFYTVLFLTFLFAVLCECEFLPFSRQGYSLIALFFIFFSFVRFEIREIPLWDIVLPLFNSFIFTLVFQLMLSQDIAHLNETTLMGNFALNAGITYALLFITNRVRLAITVSNILLTGFAFVDYMVISFRGSEIKFCDIYSLRTGMSVMGQYKIEFTRAVIYAFVVLAFVLFFAWSTKVKRISKRNQLPRITAVLCVGIALNTVSWCMNNSENYMQLWATDGIKYNGLTYNFLIEARDSRVEVPEGYSDEKANKILSAYGKGKSEKDTPNIIVIMSEAFADLSIIGEYETNKDPMEFYNSIKENCTKGYALSSVYGGNTATSEWEFLTGNTQAFLPYGSIAYQQYIKSKANSIVDVMRENGYTTVAMHPFKSTGWRRNIVYDVFGFDEIYFEEELTRQGRVRGFISDSTLFGDIINRFENKKDGEKLFCFAITMQNHGGYEFGGFPSEVTVDGMDILSVNQYLTLLDKSDNALRELITYFESADEETMIVMFGDHFPAVKGEFYTNLMGKEYADSYEGTIKRYMVPYMIWTNYDTPEEKGELTSLNFLSTEMMKRAGIGLTPYYSYLDSLREKMPVISFFAYHSALDGKLKRPGEATGEELRLLNEYRTVQYKNVFNP